ncbi:alpha/beta hydrolase [Gracilibacillus oryzae]|uniref:Alpha/beta hydrolase n=1 Tax=Gracilibacillus oryzae TaxID=1672701 RepID=A0A7C8GTH7_9BACI|nr:alpha/beta hydrolase [Gracilibacillus oryzae]KAB8136237.1 alpha/beta hydrolase [Gracilibacillus oryzae]
MSSIKFDYPVKEITYKEINDRKLKFYIFEPETALENKPVLLFFIGGSFKKDPVSPARFQHQAHYFASKGILSICVDYRNGKDEGFSPIQAICDVKSAVRWVRENASNLGVNPNELVVCGSSAGSYIAVSSIMFDELNDDNDNLKINHIPNALIIFAGGMDAVDIMTRRYPELIDKATEISPLHQVKKCLPPTLWLCGDSERDYEQNKTFVKRMNEQGNDISFYEYEGGEHGFFHYGRHENKYYHETLTEMENFLKLKGYI